MDAARGEDLIAKAIAVDGWQTLGALDAAVNLAQSLKAPSLVSLVDQPELIPADYWRVQDAGDGDIIFKGAVAMQVSGTREPDLASLPEVTVHLTPLTLYEALNDSYIGEAA